VIDIVALSREFETFPLEGMMIDKAGRRCFGSTSARSTTVFVPCSMAA